MKMVLQIKQLQESDIKYFSFVKDGQLVILKSTVPPFTSENDVAKPLRKFAKVDVAFCPERLSEGNAIEECRNIPIVVGGWIS